MLNLDLIQTVAFAGVVLFIGYALCRWIRPPPFPVQHPGPGRGRLACWWPSPS